jgi:hypothetical protein
LAHLREQRVGEKDANPKETPRRPTESRRHQSSTDSISSQNAPDFFNTPHTFSESAINPPILIRRPPHVPLH